MLFYSHFFQLFFGTNLHLDTILCSQFFHAKRQWNKLVTQYFNNIIKDLKIILMALVSRDLVLSMHSEHHSFSFRLLPMRLP